MKICDVTQFYSPKSGGVRRYLNEKRNYVLEQTEDEHVLIVPGEETEIIEEGRLTRITIKSPLVNRTSRYRVLFNTRELRYRLEDLKPDIIESGDPYHVAWTALRMGREMRVPVFGFYHSHFPEAYLRTVLKYCGKTLRDATLTFAEDYIVNLYNRFDGTFVAADHLRELLTSWGLDNTISVKLGVNTKVFKPEPSEHVDESAFRRRHGIPDDRFVLLYVGRLAGEKNVSTLLRAFEKLNQSEPRRFHLVIIGEGPQRNDVLVVKERTKAVSWRSYVDNSGTLASFYRAADLFVHPGIHETFGLVLLEAQACGCPAVGFHGSFMDANVMAGLDLWATERSADALATAINGMTTKDIKALGREASRIVREQYAWPTVLAEQWRHYRAALEAPRKL